MAARARVWVVQAIVGVAFVDLRAAQRRFCDTVTRWEWEGYTREYIEAGRKN